MDNGNGRLRQRIENRQHLREPELRLAAIRGVAAAPANIGARAEMLAAAAQLRSRTRQGEHGSH
jgi:hypothetical protein